MSEIGITSETKPSDEFATIPDVPIPSDSQRVQPNQIASGVTRGTQIIMGADGSKITEGVVDSTAQLAIAQYDNTGKKVSQYGQQSDGANSLRFFDANGIPNAQFGKYANGTIVLKIAKAGIDVTTATDDQLIFNSNQNVFKIATILQGSAYTHTISAAEITAQFAQFSFAHNLGYRPKIDASFINSSDGLTRQMPFTYKGPQTYYLGNGGGAVIEIQSISNTNINCAFYILDASGLSWLLSSGTLSFKFYCQQETLI